jgi:hypothetical protein
MAATPISSPNSTELVAAFELKTVQHQDYTQHLTKWLKIKDLGQGSFGKVWLEQETSSKQLRAIKAVWRGSQIDYLREIRALAALTQVDTAAMRWFEPRKNETTDVLLGEFVFCGVLWMVAG